MGTMNDITILRRKELAGILGVSPLTIRVWEKQGLPVIQINQKTKYYDLNKVKIWMKKQK